LNTSSTTLQTNTTDLIKDIRQNIGNITSSTSQINQVTFENIKNKSERLTQQYTVLKAETEKLKTNINENRQRYNTGFNSTKQKVLTGIQQRLTAIVGTLAQPPNDPDGARLIQEIDGLLASVDG
jgi:phage-related minor tail protein